jgi:hypothetical protein
MVFIIRLLGIVDNCRNAAMSSLSAVVRPCIVRIAKQRAKLNTLPKGALDRVSEKERQGVSENTRGSRAGAMLQGAARRCLSGQPCRESAAMGRRAAAGKACKASSVRVTPFLAQRLRAALRRRPRCCRQREKRRRLLASRHWRQPPPGGWGCGRERGGSKWRGRRGAGKKLGKQGRWPAVEQRMAWPKGEKAAASGAATAGTERQPGRLM